jgi:hypothetical protein
MQELSARAALVSTPEVSDGLTATVSREEVTAALRASEAPPDLVLDVTRFSNGDPAETRNLVVAWERSDLEELLRQTEGEQVVLTFDREAIRQAMEADVEAHGIREKALVLAVAAMTATGVAANASAGVSPDDRAVSKATSVGQVEIPYLSHGTLTPDAGAPGASLSPDDRAVSMAAPTTGAESETIASEIPYLSHGTLTPGDAAAGASLSPDDRAVSMAAPTTGAESETIASEIPYLSHGTLTPGDAAAGASLSPDDRAVSMAAPTTGAASEAVAATGSLSPDDRAVSMAAPAPADVAAADSGISISAPDPAVTAGIGAALAALAITGAAFVVAGKRRVTPA